MKRAVILLFCAAIAATPLSAQGVDIGLWAVSTTLQGDNAIDDVNSIEINFDENVGYGVTADIGWTERWSTEIGVYGFDADGSLDLGFLDESIDLGSLDVQPITATLRYHFGGDRVDFYLGGGAAYALFQDLKSDDLRAGGTELIEIDDELTWLANIGLSIQITEGFAIGIDGKWIPLEADTLSNNGEELTLELDPVMISGGILLRF